MHGLTEEHKKKYPPMPIANVYVDASGWVVWRIKAVFIDGSIVSVDEEYEPEAFGD